MSNAFFEVPIATNEPILSYAPNSPEKIKLQAVLKEMQSSSVDVPMIINGEAVYTDDKHKMVSPHNRAQDIGTYNKGTGMHVQKAIDAALSAKPQWEATPWHERAAIFLKAADLLAGPYRARMNAATMICQSKNAFQAEIDAVCELADFYRFNVQYMTEIYSVQPESAEGIWNRLEYRALEGFVFALSPFNFTSIAGNLSAAPALMGNVIVWKPAETEIYSARIIMEILEEAGLPAGVINLVFVGGKDAGEVIFKDPNFAGLHFTGSTGVFQQLWKTIGDNIQNYKSYPRIVGETGGKDFVMVHNSAHPIQVATALSRGAFEYQGQKCSAASRAYIPNSLSKDILDRLVSDVKSFKMGVPDDFSNFINAVIDEKAFDKLAGFIDRAQKDDNVEIIVGGKYDKSKGFFIEPTVIVSKDPHYVTMCEELFGPILSIFVYDDEDFEKTMEILDSTSPYALTGSIFAKDRYVIKQATEALKNCAGNFYINDKPTGAVVGQQPFGGARGSGTNDKAGSVLNLYRWVSPRTIKETFVSPIDYKYPFLG